MEVYNGSTNRKMILDLIMLLIMLELIYHWTITITSSFRMIGIDNHYFVIYNILLKVTINITVFNIIKSQKIFIKILLEI